MTINLINNNHHFTGPTGKEPCGDLDPAGAAWKAGASAKEQDGDVR